MLIGENANQPQDNKAAIDEVLLDQFEFVEMFIYHVCPSVDKVQKKIALTLGTSATIK